jgi:hypothetical protein
VLEGRVEGNGGSAEQTCDYQQLQSQDAMKIPRFEARISRMLFTNSRANPMQTTLNTATEIKSLIIIKTSGVLRLNQAAARRPLMDVLGVHPGRGTVGTVHSAARSAPMNG